MKLSESSKRVLNEILEIPGITFGRGRDSNTARRLAEVGLVEWRELKSGVTHYAGWYATELGRANDTKKVSE